MKARFATAVPALALALAGAADAQESVRERVAALEYPPLRFAPVEAEVRSVRGVSVHYVRDDQLPLATFYATFEGGPRRFSRDRFAAASAVPALLRNGGTVRLPPDSVDVLVESMALAMSFGQGGGRASSWVNSLSDGIEGAVALWSEMLREPRFDSAQVELWRASELERARRRSDDPASLAFAHFNRIMFGDHPVGWRMSPSDLEPADLAEERLRFVHGAVFCPERMILGVTGNVSWSRAAELLEAALADWPPCSGDLREDPAPRIRTEAGVFVLHKPVAQSVVVLAGRSRLRQGDDPRYFAAQIGNSILGASGLSSRLAAAVRDREGQAYGASSIWTTSTRNDGLAGALTRTKPETTLAATRSMLDVIDSLRTAPPSEAEVSHAIAEIVNGFVFNFRTPFQVVARAIAHESLGLGPDWLDRYVAGVERVRPEAVLDVVRAEVDPARMTVLLVGDTTRFDGSPSELGPVTAIEDERAPPPRASSRRRESPRSRR